MNDAPDQGEPPPPGGPAAPGGPGAEGQPSEEELRRQIEERMRDVRVQDVLLESVVTLVNITARRIGKEDERDLEQAKVGIDAVRAVVDLLEPEPRAQVQNALSELQVLYAKHAGGEDAAPAEGDDAGQQPPQPQQPRPQPQKRGGPGGPGGLWTPPGT